MKMSILTVVVLLTSSMVQAAVITYDFDDSTLQGWSLVSTDSQGRQFFALVPPSVSSPNTTPQAGAHFIGLHIPAFTLTAPAYTQDGAHDTLLLRSPEFTLNGAGDLTAWLSGGGQGAPSLAGASDVLPGATSSGGFLGVALRNATTGNYVLSASRTANSNEWERIFFTASQLALLPQNHLYTLDLIDARHGGWGWVSMDSVLIPGASPALGFLQQPSSQTGDVGDTFVFTSLAVGNPPPAYQWQYAPDGNTWELVTDGNQPTLSLGSAPYSARGSYRVIASNTSGSVISNAAVLNLSFPQPEITQQPAPTGVEEGQGASFTVIATGLGNLSYQWFKDGVVIPGASSTTLTLGAVTQADSGVYSARISDDAAVSAGLEPMSVFTEPAILIIGNLADYEAGLTFRLYDIQEDMDQLYPLVPGQTPNVDQKRSTIDWSTSADFAGYTQQFLVECFASLDIATAGSYEFRLTSDDGSKLWIDETMVIDHDGLHGATPMDGNITLGTGLHPLKLRFFQSGGGFALKLEWRPPGAADFTTVPASAFLTESGVTRVVAPGKKEIITPGDGSRPGSGQPLNSVHPSWRVTTIHPSSFNPKVGAMAVHPTDGRLFITTFNPNQNSTPNPLPGGDGKVWALSNVQGEDPEAVTVTEVAAGLSEPLGMIFVNGELHVSQRTSVTRLRDTNADGYYETHENIGGGWASDNYHQFHFGLIENNGFSYSTLSTSIHFSYPGLNGPNPPNRGTLVRTNLSTGEVSFLAGGLRTPNGLCFGPEGEIFQTDNQGAWMPASRLNHLQPGKFYGHYNTSSDGGSPSLFSDQPPTPPAVWFPQNEIANSPSQPISIPDGPFAGDLLVGDVTLGGINRVSLEMVRGAWQGCIYRFTHGLEGGVNRLAWGPNGTLYVGCIGASGNWAWNGTTTGLQRLTPKSGNPVTFEIAEVSATDSGFEISYTKPVPVAALENPANFTVRQWSYQATADYGGPKIGEETLAVASATASDDRTKVVIVVPGLEEGHVVYLKSDPVSDDGSAILSSEVWYTLNQIPGGPHSLQIDQSGVLENEVPGTVVGTLSASHDNSGEVIAFSLPAGVADNHLFAIDGDHLVTTSSFDYERRSSYSVRVRATDESGLSGEVNLAIAVIDEPVENAPRRIQLTNAVLPPDHAAGAFVGRLLMDDEDLGDLQSVMSSAVASDPVLHESFEYPVAGELNGRTGGVGFSGPWQVSGPSGSIPGDSLGYTDTLGLTLASSGNRALCLPDSRNNRPLSAARGAVGTVTYVSFLVDPGNNAHFWGVEFWNGPAADGNRVLQVGNQNGFGVRVRNLTNKFFTTSDSNPHFFVLKIEHLAGNDRISVWIDPHLSAEPSTPDLLFSPAETGGSVPFDRLGFSDYVTTSAPMVDEIRLGNDWSSVTPHQPTFPLFELVSGEGDQDNGSFTLVGNQLFVDAPLPGGLRSVRLRVSDSAGLSLEQPVLIWVGSGHLDSNGDGIDDATSIRLGFDPAGAEGSASYFGSGTRPDFGLVAASDEFQLTIATLPGNLYWIERSPDLVEWTLDRGSIATPRTFLDAGNQWSLPRPDESRQFWRVGGGWPDQHGINPLENGLAGIVFPGGSSVGWAFDPATGILSQHSGSPNPSEWVHFGTEYGDFMLSLEYRVSSGANAGVFVRAAAVGNPWVTGSEIQITNEPRLPIHATGALYDRVAAYPAVDASHSVWHKMEVLMVGDRVRINVDGIPTVDVLDLGTEYPAYPWSSSGLIGLQDSHGLPGSIEYRNVRIVSLDPAE